MAVEEAAVETNHDELEQTLAGLGGGVTGWLVARDDMPAMVFRTGVWRVPV